MISVSYIYAAIEAVFYLIFIFVLKPRANDLSKRTSQEYRDYGTKRHLLFKRIIHRLHKRCLIEKKEMKRELDTFFWSWFNTVGHTNAEKLYKRSMASKSAAAISRHLPRNCDIDTSASCCSLSTLSHTSGIFDFKGGGESEVSSYGITDGIDLYEDELMEFFAWAFFDNEFCQLDKWELEEMDLMFQYMRDRFKIQYPSVRTGRRYVHGDSRKSFTPSANENEEEGEDDFFLRPRRMTLEDVNAFHRPILVYIIFWIIRHIGYAIMLFLGFRPHTIECESDSSKVLRYWFLPRGDANTEQSHEEAILFFHGIAPGGLTFYLPFLRSCVINKWDSTSNNNSRRHQSIFLFENMPITSSNISFHALTEEETISAVEKAMMRHGFDRSRSKITLSGHSFGSFQLTWMLRSPFLKKRVHKIVLLDPVSILLSDPPVISNFVYDGGNDERTTMCWLKGKGARLKIKLIASSELFIGHYLRRHFAWYNSELWMEDIPDHINTFVMISGKDAIINAPKVRQEVHRHLRSKKVKCIFWEGHGHGDCIVNSKLFTDVSNAISFPHYKQD